MGTTFTKLPVRRNGKKPPAWEALKDEQLLDLRFCDLTDLSIEGSWLSELTEQVRGELHERGLRFNPHFWLSSEWFSPEGVPGVAIPFYLASKRLMRLEERMMYDVEGGIKRTCLMLLRHEVGHAIEAAYRLDRRAGFRKHFGKASKPYPTYYSPKPFSRQFVLHLDWWYAQSHPCEDFAETFAVWLRPGSQWRRRYRNWGAFRKLEYMDEVMNSIRKKSPLVRTRMKIDPISRLKTTLRDHYLEKRKRYGSEYPDFFDSDLRKLFVKATPDADLPTASSCLRKIGPSLRNRVAIWTGEYAYTVDQVLKDMIARSRELNLRVNRPAEELKIELAILLTMQVTNYLHSSEHRLAI